MRVMLCDLEPNNMTRIIPANVNTSSVGHHIGHSSPIVYSIDELSRAVGTRGCDCALEARLAYWDATLIPRGVLGGIETLPHHTYGACVMC